ncbi:MAG TPA: DUF6069 family protein [Naasia sp.]
MNDIAAPLVRPRPRAVTRTLLVLAGVAASALLTGALALAALALGADPAFPPLQPQVYLTFATGGTLAAVAGWILIVRTVRRSARVLRVLVPTLVAASLVPDVALLLTGFIPGTTPLAVVALMLMHPAVAAVAVAVGLRVAPPR